MKFKGFFKGYWNVCKESFAWLKDYWFLYTIFTIVLAIIICLPSLIDLYRLSKPSKSEDNQDYDFLD